MFARGRVSNSTTTALIWYPFNQIGTGTNSLPLIQGISHFKNMKLLKISIYKHYFYVKEISFSKFSIWKQSIHDYETPLNLVSGQKTHTWKLKPDNIRDTNHTKHYILSSQFKEGVHFAMKPVWLHKLSFFFHVISRAYRRTLCTKYYTRLSEIRCIRDCPVLIPNFFFQGLAKFCTVII